MSPEHIRVGESYLIRTPHLHSVPYCGDVKVISAKTRIDYEVVTLEDEPRVLVVWCIYFLSRAVIPA